MTLRTSLMMSVVFVGCVSSRQVPTGELHEPARLEPSSQKVLVEGNSSGQPLPNHSSTGTNVYPSPTHRAALPGSTAAAFTWQAFQLELRPTTHLATGKRRSAAIVQTADNTRELVVHEFPPAAGHSAPRLRVTAPLPAELLATPGLQLFMGRDDWPRIIAAAPSGGQKRTYLRFRPGRGWESPLDEQGALAARGRASGYYGVLGHADPEVLCVGNFACYEKRNSGWKKRAVPGPGVWNVVVAPEPATINPHAAWAWPSNGANSLLRLSDEWEISTPPPPEPVRHLTTWRGSPVVLTAAGLYQLAHDVRPVASDTEDSGTRAAPFNASRWAPLVRFEDGSTVSPSSSSWLWVGTEEGLYKWDRDDVSLVPVHLEIGTEPPTAPTRTCCILPLLEPSPRFLSAGADGVFVLAAPGAASPGVNTSDTARP
jgi:hypothetical protein